MKKTEKLRKFIKNQAHWIVLVSLAVMFFLLVSSYNYFTQQTDYIKWGSPDENANYIFTKLYAETGELEFFEKYNLYASDIIHPRSFRSDWGMMKPVSFLGIILLYGSAASFLGSALIPFLTPFIAAIGIIFYYFLIKRFFGKRIALISSSMLSFFPVYIYYSARSMFHNVLFVVLLVIGLYLITLIRQLKPRRAGFWQMQVGNHVLWSWLITAGAGAFIGLALLTRASEILWLGPLLLIIGVANLRKVGITRLVIFIAFLFLALSPMFYWNQILYGSPIQGGYADINQSIISVAEQGGQLFQGAKGQLWSAVSDFIFYFGFHPYESARMFYYYFVKMFPWLFVFGSLGLLILITKIRKWQKRHYLYLISLLVISIILILYYGSWKFTDNPDPNSFTIGNSYTRYWLPIYLGVIPLAAMFIVKASRSLFYWVKSKVKRHYLIFVTRLLVLWAIIASSLFFVTFGSEEGLYYTHFKALSTQGEYNRILANTETNAVIITQYHDKVLFPERKVINGLLTDPNMNYYYAQLAKKLPVYYYNFTFPEKDIQYLNDRVFVDLKITIRPVKKLHQDFTLYRLESYE